MHKPKTNLRNQIDNIISMLDCGLCLVHLDSKHVGVLFKYYESLLSTEELMQTPYAIMLSLSVLYFDVYHLDIGLKY